MSAKAEQQVRNLQEAATEERRKVVNSDLVISIGDTDTFQAIPQQRVKSVTEWSEHAVRAISYDVVGEILEQQRALDNEVEQMLFDSSPLIDPLKQMRTIDAIFDVGTNVRQIMESLEAAVAANIPRVRWKWRVFAGATSDISALQREVSSGGPVHMNYGDRLYYVPASSPIDITYWNVRKVRGARPAGTGALGPTKSRGKPGYFTSVTRSVKAQAAAAGVHVRSVHSLKIEDPWRKLPPGVQQGDGGPRGVKAYYQGSWAFRIALLRGR